MLRSSPMLKTKIGRSLSMHSVSAVVSITLRPRSIASMWLMRGISRASGSSRGSASSTPSTAVLGHQDALRADLERAQGGGRVGGEERVAGAAGEDDDPLLLEVADRPAPDVGLGDLLHRDRRLHPGRHARASPARPGSPGRSASVAIMPM